MRIQDVANGERLYAKNKVAIFEDFVYFDYAALKLNALLEKLARCLSAASLV